MAPASSLTLFFAAALLLLAVPGPAVLYIVTRSIDHGPRAGIVSALGIAAGSVALVFATAFGVSALVAASPVAYDAIRYAGGAYLVVLGVRTWRRPVPATAVAAPRRASMGRLFRDGIVVNFLNPKTAIFFLAFLPQFIDPLGRVRLQLVVLGLTFVAMGVVTDSIYALAAGATADKLRAGQRFPRVQRLVVGAVYVSLGVAAALVHPTN